MHYVYIIKREGEKGYYTGFSSDLKQRLKKHNYRQKTDLVYYEAYLSESMARQREKDLKQFGGAWRSLRKRLNLK